MRPGPPAIAAAVPLAAAPLQLAVPTPGSPPVLDINGTADSVIPFAWAEDACARATEVGASCEVAAFEGAGHPAVDPNPIVPTYGEEVRRLASEFIAREVLAPLGNFGTPTTPTTPTGPTTPAAPAATPAAEPATPVPGQPRYTG